MGCSFSSHKNFEISSLHDFTESDHEKPIFHRLLSYDESATLIHYREGKLEKSKNDDKTMDLSNTCIKEESIISEKDEEINNLDNEQDLLKKITKNMEKLTKKSKRFEEDRNRKIKELNRVLEENKKLKSETKELECENSKLEANLDLTLRKLEIAINMLKKYEKIQKK